jgi:TatD DNase family protein
MLIDTHCHLDFPDFDIDRDAVVTRAREAGVGVIVNVASGLKASRDAVALAGRIDGVYATVGVHPHDAKDLEASGFEEIKRLAGSPRVVAIGEVGLDYYRNLSPQDVQIKVFRGFIELAVEKTLPLIVHSRMAFQETLDILGPQAGRLTGVVVHCFSGDPAHLKACLDLGFYVSFTGNITYKKADRLRDVVRLCPLERMFLETDAPFLSPEGKRGSRNEPAYVGYVRDEVARLKDILPDEVARVTTENARRFFKFNP